VSETFNHVLNLIERGEVRISDHGYDELAADNIFVRDIVNGIAQVIVVRGLSRLSKGPVRIGSTKRSR